MCAIPSINIFSPSKLRAGNGEVLTINGTNFGTQRGVVQFRNANVGFCLYCRLR
ncbi:MAG: IPT/TIG domain-containing protein [Bacteroidetes bacterium]|nr:IPT/TIG domain-containing protein [Bacteroidota bacterium]